MKRLYVMLALALGLYANAQISDLASMANGELQMFSPIYEHDESVYGYFLLYLQDVISQNEEKYEYVILDKNLNEVSNGSFVDVVYKGLQSRFFSPERLNNKLLITKRFNNTTGNIVFASSRYIRLDENFVGDPFYFENDQIINGNRDIKTIKKVERKKDFFNVPIATENGTLVIQMAKGRAFENPTHVDFFDVSNTKIWDYDFSGDPRTFEYSLEGIDEEAIYFVHSSEHPNNNFKRLVALNPDNGEELFSYIFEKASSEYSYDLTIKKIGNNTILSGKISPYSKSGYKSDNAKGLFKIVIDAQGNELFKKHFLWEQTNKYLKMSKSGKLEEGYKLFAHSYFIFNDERIIVLSEKYKVAVNLLLGEHVKTEDFILMEFDKDFELVRAEAIEKDLSKFSSTDFLFAQYLNDENDAVFFYYDYQKDPETREKNWILGIVSMVDGEINHEKVPMSADDFFIQPFIAKEGYILLREFNKDSEFNSIRLERLNLN